MLAFLTHLRTSGGPRLVCPCLSLPTEGAFLRKDSNPEFSLLTASATHRQKKIAVAAAISLCVALVISVPFAEMPLRRIDTFIPTFESTVVITDLITSILLFSHFSISGSRALLVLASGYLFTSLIVVSHVLTFPGAFSPTGLLGAGRQSAGWLYFFWHFGFALTLAVYAYPKHNTPAVETSANFSSPSALALSVAIVVGLACALTLLVTVGERLLPPVFLDPINFAPLGRYILILNALVCGIALLLFWRKRQRSTLDVWLAVVTVALIFELVTNSILISARFTLGWYVSRLFSIATSTTILAALLQETIWLYGRMMRSHATLLQERDSRMLSLEALAGAIKHEVAQPLGAAQLNAETLKLLVKGAPAGPDEMSLVAGEIVASIRRATDVIDDIRALFGKDERQTAPVNVNDVVLAALHNLDRELKLHGIVVRLELMSGIPEITVQRGQVEELLLNLIRNAIDAMTLNVEPPELHIKTESAGNAVRITVADNGPGIDPKKSGEIFEPFFTTKQNGVGLGLAICRMIIDRYGGHISVSPVKPHGSSFEITLPQ